MSKKANTNSALHEKDGIPQPESINKSSVEKVMLQRRNQPSAKELIAGILAQDKVAATLMGVDVKLYSMIGFALGAMLAGVVGGLLVTITGVNLGMGGPTSIKAFMMIMIGGAGVISGAIAGGFILAMMESIGLTVLAAYGDITYLVIFACLMIFLAIRPQGLMGKPWG